MAKKKRQKSKEYKEEEVQKLLDPVRDAFEAGVPQDQVKQFLDRLYVPLPWQWKFHALAREACSTARKNPNKLHSLAVGQFPKAFMKTACQSLTLCLPQ